MASGSSILDTLPPPPKGGIGLDDLPPPPGSQGGQKPPQNPMEVSQGQDASAGGRMSSLYKTISQKAGKYDPETEGMVSKVDKQLDPEHVSELGAALNPGESAAKPISGLASWIGQKTGLSKIPGALMEAATGVKGGGSQVGQKLIDEGLWGTKNSLTKQVGSKIEGYGKDLSSEVAQLPGKISSQPAADAIKGHLSDFQTSGGITPQATAEERNLIGSRASDVASRGDVDPTEALELKRIAQRQGYRHGDPLSSLKSKVSRSEAEGYGSALEDAYSKANPDSPNRISDLNSSLSALLKGKQGLEHSDKISTLTDLTHLLKGKALNLLTGGSLGKSTAAQALSKGSSGATRLADQQLLKESKK